MAQADLKPETVLSAYTRGAFPMTDADGVTRWYTADPRGILPFDRFHVPKTLRQTVRQGRFEIRVNADFEGTMRDCMLAVRRGEVGSWISNDLIACYATLNRFGYAHSVEAWQNDTRVGGLYGVALGGVFFGESMYHTVRDASKVALVALVDRLRERGYELLDTQASTPHLQRFGCVEIPADVYMRRLQTALRKHCRFDG
ncbi:MAG: leucyl/phenylalanyl-tRNA--protein transferase [Planctomycetota bacterium]